MEYLLCFNIIFMLYSLAKIYLIDIRFFVLYLAMCMYSIAPFAGRIIDNDLVNIVSHVTVNNTDTILEYILYCDMFLVMCFLCIINKKWLNFSISIQKYVHIKECWLLFILIEISIIGYLGYQYISHVSEMSYFNQHIVKGNILWYYFLDISPVFILLNIIDYFNHRKMLCKLLLILLGSILFYFVINTCMSIGNRGILMPHILSGIITYISYIKFKGKNSGKNKAILICSLCIMILFSQYIRSERGGDGGGFSADAIFNIFDFSRIIFQDYVVPGNAIMYFIDENMSIGENFQYLIFVIQSNISHVIVGMGDAYPTVAGYVSRIVAPNDWFGIGGFIIQEAYLSLSFIGCILYPMIIVSIIKFQFNLFYKRNDISFNLYFLYLSMAFLSFGIVRGQSYLLVKVIYMYYLPMIILYNLMLKNNKEG